MQNFSYDTCLVTSYRVVSQMRTISVLFQELRFFNFQAKEEKEDATTGHRKSSSIAIKRVGKPERLSHIYQGARQRGGPPILFIPKRVLTLLFIVAKGRLRKALLTVSIKIKRQSSMSYHTPQSN